MSMVCTTDLFRSLFHMDIYFFLGVKNGANLDIPFVDKEPSSSQDEELSGEQVESSALHEHSGLECSLHTTLEQNAQESSDEIISVCEEAGSRDCSTGLVLSGNSTTLDDVNSDCHSTSGEGESIAMTPAVSTSSIEVLSHISLECQLNTSGEMEDKEESTEGPLENEESSEHGSPDLREQVAVPGDVSSVSESSDQEENDNGVFST